MFWMDGPGMDQSVPQQPPQMHQMHHMQYDAVDTRFNQLELTLEQFQETARHLGVIASDFTPRSQDALNQKLYTLISGLQELDMTRRQFDDVKIPLELLNFLDEGKNPQLYTKEVLERTLQKNKEVNGKIEMYKKFKSKMLQELGEEMPEVALKYRIARPENPT